MWARLWARLWGKQLTATVVVCMTIACVWPVTKLASGAETKKKPDVSTDAPQTNTLETYRDLIEKAQNLTLQRDRIQTSQVLMRALKREKRGSQAFRELQRTLEELTTVFYSEKAQSLHSSAEALLDSKPHEAVDLLLEALRLEDGNVALLKTLTRAYLRLSECDKAESSVTQLEAMDAVSAEVKLLRLQSLNCQKNYTALESELDEEQHELEPVERYLHGFEVDQLLRKHEFKKAKAAIVNWENKVPGYPEIYYWKWRLSQVMLRDAKVGEAGAATSPSSPVAPLPTIGSSNAAKRMKNSGSTSPAQVLQPDSVDRASAVRYVQLCQGLSPRKRKSFVLDVDLCQGKEAAELFLKESGTGPTPNPR